MVWILAGLVALGLVLCPSRFRRIGFAVVGILFFVFVTVVVLNRRTAPDTHSLAASRDSEPSTESRRFDFDRYERDKKDKADPDAAIRIPASQLRFGQVQAVSGIDAGAIQSVRARLYNDSHTFTLTDYSYYLVIQDCLAGTHDDGAGRCTTVYDQRGTVSQMVPPDQARDVVIVIPKNQTNFSLPFKLLGTPRVDLTVSDTRAYQPAPAP